jgi:hypothetical protein
VSFQYSAKTKSSCGASNMREFPRAHTVLARAQRVERQQLLRERNLAFLEAVPTSAENCCRHAAHSHRLRYETLPVRVVLKRLKFAFAAAEGHHVRSLPIAAQ